MKDPELKDMTLTEKIGTMQRQDALINNFNPMQDVQNKEIVKAFTFSPLNDREFMDRVIFKHRVKNYKLNEEMDPRFINEVTSYIEDIKKRSFTDQAKVDSLLAKTFNSDISANSSFQNPQIFDAFTGVFKNLKGKTTEFKPVPSLLESRMSTSSSVSSVASTQAVEVSVLNKILEEYGDLTVREIVEKIQESADKFTEIKEKVEETIGLKIEPSAIINVVTPLILYRGILKIYDQYTDSEYKANIAKFSRESNIDSKVIADINKLVMKEKFIFRAVAAPLLVLGLVSVAKVIGKNFITVELKTEEDKTGTDDSNLMFSPVSILFNSIKNKDKDNNSLLNNNNNKENNNQNNIKNESNTPRDAGETTPNKFKNLGKFLSKIVTFAIVGIFFYKNKNII